LTALRLEPLHDLSLSDFTKDEVSKHKRGVVVTTDHERRADCDAVAIESDMSG
jgi:hypothetical protein